MTIQKIEVNIANSGHITNTYIVYDDTNIGIVIDPGDEFEKIKSKIDEFSLSIKYIVITHEHFDHINALNELVEYTKATVILNKEDAQMLFGDIDNASQMFGLEKKSVDKKVVTLVEDGEEIQVGNTNFKLIHTPGHTAGAMIIFVPDEKVAFTGDTLFSNAYGRCDLLTADFNKMVGSLRKIFSTLPSDVVIYPGHGESSTILKSQKYISLLLAMKGIKLK